MMLNGLRNMNNKILTAAIDLAAVHGYTNVTRHQIAEMIDCAPSLIPYHFGTMKQLRRSIMGEAIRTKNLIIIAQGLTAKDSRALGCSDELKRAACEYLCV